MFEDENIFTLPETNSKFAPENSPKLPQKERIVFQPSIFRVELLVSGSVIQLPSVPFGFLDQVGSVRF